MTRYQDTLWCDGCGVEITWAPLVVGNREYCCQDCFEGLPCACGERQEMEEGRRAASEAAEGGGAGGLEDAPGGTS